MTQEQQWQEDIRQFGELAYLMWEISKGWAVTFNFISCENYTVECALADKRSDVRRKQSAALPFDLVAANAGDGLFIGL